MPSLPAVRKPGYLIVIAFGYCLITNKQTLGYNDQTKKNHRYTQCLKLRIPEQKTELQIQKKTMVLNLNKPVATF